MTKKRRQGAYIEVYDGLKVTKHMVDAAELLVSGYSVADAAEHLGINKNTITHWLRKDDDFKKLLETFSQGLLEEIKLELVISAREALSTLQGLLHSENDQIRLSAAKDILDRAGFKPSNKKEIDVTQTVNYFANMSDDELMKFISLNPSEVIDVEVDTGEDDRGSPGEDGIYQEEEP